MYWEKNKRIEYQGTMLLQERKRMVKFESLNRLQPSNLNDIEIIIDILSR